MIRTLFLIGAAVAAPALAAQDCAALHEKHLAEDMDLDYRTFDQTPGSGFRALARAGCPAEAADLIEAWAEANAGTQRSLTWHVAQLRGQAGQIDAALDAARRSLASEEIPDPEFRWNAHVRAYIAFLEGDRAAFDRELAALDSAADAHPGNAINARMWRELAPHFEAGYAEAIERAYGGN